MIDIFVHIPKTSGSTVRSILSRQYGVQSIVYCEPSSRHWPPGVSIDSYITGEMRRRDIRLITGHQRYGLHEYVKKPCRYFSMLRDPMERSLSNFFYAYSYPEHPKREQIVGGKLSFESFVASQANDPSSSQSYMVAGPYESSNILATAIANLHSGFSAIGISERFDESLLYFAKRLGWAPPLYFRKNVTRLKDDLAKKRIAEGVMAASRLSSAFHDDYALYEAATGLLDAWIRQQGNAFQTALGAFQELQKALRALEDDSIFDEFTFLKQDILADRLPGYFNSTAFKTVSDYLQDPGSNGVAIHNYCGYVDRFSDGTISGWAMDLFSDESIDVVVRHGSRALLNLPCSRVREDVLKAGYPRATVGFTGNIDTTTLPYSEISVCFESTRLKLMRHSAK